MQIGGGRGKGLRGRAAHVVQVREEGGGRSGLCGRQRVGSVRAGERCGVGKKVVARKGDWAKSNRKEREGRKEWA